MVELTRYAQMGYDAGGSDDPEFTAGSNAFMAWRVGQWLKNQGGNRPAEVSPDHGYSLMVDGVRIVLPSAGYGEPCIANAWGTT